VLSLFFSHDESFTHKKFSDDKKIFLDIGSDKTIFLLPQESLAGSKKTFPIARKKILRQDKKCFVITKSTFFFIGNYLLGSFSMFPPQKKL